MVSAVVYQKQIDGSYYVVQAVPDTKKRTTYIVSAYMQKNEGPRFPITPNGASGGAQGTATATPRGNQPTLDDRLQLPGLLSDDTLVAYSIRQNAENSNGTAENVQSKERKEIPALSGKYATLLAQSTSTFGNLNNDSIAPNRAASNISNKKRTDTWSMSLRVQFPSDQPVYGSMGRVTYTDDGVKIQGRNIFSARCNTFGFTPEQIARPEQQPLSGYMQYGKAHRAEAERWELFEA